MNSTKLSIGYCGYKCHQCPARSDDPAVRQKVVDGWKKIFGHEMYTVDNVHCDGCKGNGKLADKECKARPCAMEKGIDFCTDCNDFPCDKVRPLMGSKEGMFVYLAKRAKDISREEYQMCMSQFCSMPFLMQKLVENGKLPGWVVEEE